MIREIKELPTDLGRELKTVYDRGDLVSDELMIRLIEDRLSRGDTLPGFVLDGFPRTMPQAEALDELLYEHDRPLDVVLAFQVPDREALLQRMLKRAAEESALRRHARGDRAAPGAVRRARPPRSSSTTARRGRTSCGVHADRTVDEVFQEIRQTLDEVQRRRRRPA